MLDEVPDLVQVLGQSIRELRQELDVPLEEVADCAQRYGLRWGRSSVAQLENGKRGLSAQELLLLPLILSCAFRDDITMSHLLYHHEAVRVSESRALTLPGFTVLGILGGSISSTTGMADDNIEPADPIERRVARDLGVDPIDIGYVAGELWGHSAREERDRRVRAADPLASDTRRQALRGRVTRELRAKLTEEWERWREGADHGPR